MEKNKVSKPFKTLITVVLIALLTAFGSEIKFVPHESAPFRFGLGALIFFFAILIQPVPLILTGFLTGFTVVLFRVLLDQYWLGPNFSAYFIDHLPAALFYISFSFCLKLLNVEKYKVKPLILGILATLFETVSNILEQFLTILLGSKIPYSLEAWLILLIIAFVRSFFVVGIYSAIAISEQKKQFQQLLNIGSNLYVETLYLQKSMEQIEKITASSFDLYKKLKQVDSQTSMQALLIAQEIHEVKKDSQRIYAGISKTVNKQRTDSLLISNLLQYVTEANEKYSEFLNKKISFRVSSNVDFHTNEHIALLALLNNLVANAIEAIEEEGMISISSKTFDQQTTFTVEDNGIGIPANLVSIIFDPGYTSKFNSKGEPSTGIGLSHVKEIVTKLNGEISVKSNSKTTKFTIVIPTYKLQ